MAAMGASARNGFRPRSGPLVVRVNWLVVEYRPSFGSISVNDPQPIQRRKEGMITKFIEFKDCLWNTDKIITVDLDETTIRIEQPHGTPDGEFDYDTEAEARQAYESIVEQLIESGQLTRIPTHENTETSDLESGRA